ncbi:MAG TPA: hypothetical protein VFJ19_09260 [Nocardioidaceae bacterium]|nr:hypothetical protein [Nocardioidaceae bacterium]
MTTPDQITGLVQWLRADDITGVANGGAVSSWPAAVGNAATQSTPAKQPVLVTGAVNGLPAVRSDGVDDMLLATVQAIGQPFTVFTVLHSDQGASASGFAWSLHISTPDQNSYGGWFSGAFRLLTGGSSSFYPAAAPSTPAWHVWAQRFNGASSSVRLDGTQTDGDAGFNYANKVRLCLFAFPDNSNPVLTLLAEIIVYDRLLTDAEVAQLDSYLSDRYAVTVADHVAPAGTPATATGPPAVLSITAPVGAVRSASTVTGPAAVLTLTAPAGDVAAGTVVPAGATAPPAVVTLTAPAGMVAAGTVQRAPPATLTLTAPAGTVSAGTSVPAVVTAPPAVLTLGAPAGGVAAGSVQPATVTAPAAVLTLTAPAGVVAAGGRTTAPPAVLSLTAPAGGTGLAPVLLDFTRVTPSLAFAAGQPRFGFTAGTPTFQEP